MITATTLPPLTFWLLVIFLGVVGASVGSFLNVVVYRLPRGLSLISPRSHCPSCHAPVSLIGLVPIFGYVLVRGRCQNCAVKISPEYPLVEAFCAATTLALFFFHLSHSLTFYSRDFFIDFMLSLWIFFSGLLLALIDARTHRLPNVITLPGIFLGLVFALVDPKLGLTQALIGLALASLLAACILFFFRLFRVQKSLGIGDIKYFFMIALVLGAKGFIFGMLVAAFFATLWSLIYKQHHVPFGPFIALGSLVARIVVVLFF